MTVAHGSTFTDPGATATDDVDTEVTVTTSGSVDTSTVNTYTLTYTATDTAGNAATSVTRVVNVTDQTAPVITLTGDATVTVAHGSIYSDPGATATDNVNTAVTVTTTGTVDTSTVNTYTLTYTATDAAGNEATPVTRTVNITDQTVPIIILNGEANISIDRGTTFSDPEATVTDNVDTNCTITGSGTVNTSTVGTYILTYTATDAAGNEADEVTLTVNVRPRPFVIAVRTDNPGDTNDTAFEIPIHPDATLTYRYNIDCDNDGTDEATGVDGSYTCSYTFAGEYTIAIRGAFPAIHFYGAKDYQKILTVSAWGDTEWQTFENAFRDCGNLTIEADDIPDLSHVTNMYMAFYDIDSITSDINSWDTSHVIMMGNLFRSINTFNQDISDWNTSNVTDMSYMFHSASSFNQDLSNWDTGNVQYMSYMFASADHFDQDISDWDVSQVIDMNHMFEDVVLSMDHYNDLLISWATQTVQHNVTFDGGNSLYSSIAEASRNALTDPGDNNWTITDGGIDAPPVITIHGNSNMTVAQNSAYADEGASATDAVDGALAVSTSGSVDTTVIDTYIITYSATDSLGQTTEANRTVEVVDDSDPVASDNTFRTNIDTVLHGDVSLNDTRSTDGSNSWVIVDDPTHGSMTLETDGTFAYTPDPSYFGEDNLTYKITDDHGESNIAHVRIIVRGNPFVFTVQTDNDGDSNDTAFILPTNPDATLTYRYDIDCDNDGEDEAVDVNESYTCSYSDPDTYTIAVRGSFPAIYFHREKDYHKILTVEAWGDIQWQTFEEAFRGCYLLDINATDEPDLSQVENMHMAFYSIGNITSNINGWDTGHVTTMAYLFKAAVNFNQDIGDWNTSSIISMSGMFFGAVSFDQDISGWDTHNVTDMSYMFRHTDTFNQDISDWNTSRVGSMSNMFKDAINFNGDISGWDTGQVQTMDAMFQNASAFVDHNLSSWDVSKVGTYHTDFCDGWGTGNTPPGGWTCP